MTENFLASVALLVFLSVTVCFGLMCMSVLLCCCALFPTNIVGTLLCCAGSSFLFHQSGRQNERHSHRSIDSSIPDATEDNSQFNGIVLAEAFVVAPFAEARIMKDNTSLNVGGHPEINQLESIEAESAEVESHITPMIFQDTWAAALFILQVVVIVWFAAEVSLKSVNKSHPSFEDNGLSTIVIACAVLAIAATFLGTISLSFILQKADYIIEGVMWMNIGVCAIGSVLCLASGGTILFALALGFTAVLNYWYMNSVKSRIPFASAVLSVACQAVRENFTGTIISAYFLLAVQLGWVILWSIASYGVSLNYFNSENGNREDDRLSGSQLAIIFFFLLSMHWGSEVIKAVLAVTVNGVIACWWFLPRRGAVVRGAMFRSLTTSFGSVCLGSLLVSIIHTLRSMLQLMSNRERRGESRSANDILDCIFGCLLSMMDKAVTYFNKYAFCYVAGYGMGFSESARKVIKLFSDRGWTAIINDDLVGNFLIFAMLGMTVMTALVGFFSTILLGPFLERAGISEPYIMLTVVGGLMGYAVSSIFTNVLNSGVTMVFVCMAENPSALEINHPKEYFLLTSAWSAFHPGNSWVSPPVDYGPSSQTQSYTGYSGHPVSHPQRAYSAPLGYDPRNPEPQRNPQSFEGNNFKEGLLQAGMVSDNACASQGDYSGQQGYDLTNMQQQQWQQQQWQQQQQQQRNYYQQGPQSSQNHQYNPIHNQQNMNQNHYQGDTNNQQASYQHPQNSEFQNGDITRIPGSYAAIPSAPPMSKR